MNWLLIGVIFTLAYNTNRDKSIGTRGTSVDASPIPPNGKFRSRVVQTPLIGFTIGFFRRRAFTTYRDHIFFISKRVINKIQTISLTLYQKPRSETITIANHLVLGSINLWYDFVAYGCGNNFTSYLSIWFSTLHLKWEKKMRRSCSSSRLCVRPVCNFYSCFSLVIFFLLISLPAPFLKPINPYIKHWEAAHFDANIIAAARHQHEINKRRKRYANNTVHSHGTPSLNTIKFQFYAHNR